jgi:hypothetical protein
MCRGVLRLIIAKIGNLGVIDDVYPGCRLVFEAAANKENVIYRSAGMPSGFQVEGPQWPLRSLKDGICSPHWYLNPKHQAR